MVKVWFPNMFMRLISYTTTTVPAKAKFQIPPSMTKTEVKEYLGKIYNMNVLSVNTINFLGKWKRLYSKRKVLSHKRRNYKHAYVQFNEDAVAKTVAK